MDKVLDHEQRRGPIVELFAPVGADVDAHMAAARAHALRLGQLVMPGLAGQVVRQTAAAMGLAAALGRGLGRRLSRRGRVLARGQFGEQRRLVGIDTFAARPIQAPQQ